MPPLGEKMQRQVAGIAEPAFTSIRGGHISARHLG